MATQKDMRARSQSEVFATLAQVIRTADLTPRMRRITLGGEGLSPLLTGTRLPADAIKLYLPVPGKPGFMPEFRVLPSEENPFSIRAYTIRRFDREALELDIDIVLHGDSPGSVWARNVQPGDQIGFVGPRHDYLAVEDVDWLLLAGDSRVCLAEWQAVCLGSRRNDDCAGHSALSAEGTRHRESKPAYCRVLALWHEQSRVRYDDGEGVRSGACCRNVD